MQMLCNRTSIIWLFIYFFICITSITRASQPDAGPAIPSPEATTCNTQTCIVPHYICKREKPTIQFDGFVRADTYLDGREVVASRESSLSLYPRKKFCVEHKDIYDNPFSGATAYITRLRTKLQGPKINDWNVYGVVEADFYGALDTVAQDFHMRHGYFALNNGHVELLLGQYWHPMFIPDGYPDTVSFNTGAPFDTFNRATQIRTTLFNENAQLILAALWQTVGFQSFGPEGESSVYLRKNVIPNLHAQLRFLFSDTHIVGMALDYKGIVPRTVNVFGDAIREHVQGVSAAAYYIGNFEPFYICGKLIYGQNIPDMLSIGGYGVHCHDQVTDMRSYTPFQTLQSWIFLSTTKCNFTTGLFLGVLKNLGTLKSLFFDNQHQPITFGRNPDINYVWRIAPQIRFNYKALQFGLEFEYTRAAYGDIDRSGIPRNAVPVGNLRFIFVGIYYF